MRSAFALVLAVSLGSSLGGCRRAGAPLPGPGDEGSASRDQVIRSEELFRRAAPPRLHITLPPDAIDRLRADPRAIVRATVTEGEVVYRDVGMHLKGGWGSSRTVDENPSITLNFDRFVPGQSFHRVDKIILNNSVEDPSYCREILTSAFYRGAGVPASRATVARVSLNDRDLGVYVLKEGVDRAFLRLWFRDAGGAVYEAETFDDIDEARPRRGRRPVVTGDLPALLDAARDPDPGARVRRVGALLDLDRFISSMAVESLVGTWDGYTMASNNYRVYFDPAARRFVFLPGNTDQDFSKKPQILPDETGGAVAYALFEAPEGRRRYDARLAELHAIDWDQAALDERVTALQARIRGLLVGNEVDAHDRAIAELRARIAERGERLERHLGALRDGGSLPRATPPRARLPD